jgi:hypothetical protein
MWARQKIEISILMAIFHSQYSFISPFLFSSIRLLPFLLSFLQL